jgi:hypothetical protein
MKTKTYAVVALALAAQACAAILPAGAQEWDRRREYAPERKQRENPPPPREIPAAKGLQVVPRLGPKIALEPTLPYCAAIAAPRPRISVGCGRTAACLLAAHRPSRVCTKWDVSANDGHSLTYGRC